MENLKVELATLLRTFAVQETPYLMFFLGAGASARAGIPTAGEMIWMFKRAIYCSETGADPQAFRDLSVERYRQHLQAYFDNKGEFPPRGADDEYSLYFARCYPDPEVRRSLIRQFITKGKPTIGHECLAVLLAEGRCHWVWGTNFDDLVEEDSFSYQDQARVMWWLALALYVKGRGIPWKLADPSPGTAFVGLSYGISNAVASQRIILGCSQVFDENGEGLKFLLHPVESPVFRGKNPFMSREDARRLFGNVRDIYQDVNGARPQRVVVHKTTYFTGDEMDGIANALSGIEEIELLQIQQDTRWRAIGYDGSRNLVSNFPVKRGTALPLDRYTFLLWTQGDVAGVLAKGRHYYQEKRGIPAPLVIRRFRGKDPVEQVASEILRLTKMNWNNHQLYNYLPVTITFSKELSEIAKQVQHVWRVAYDFRHFM